MDSFAPYAIPVNGLDLGIHQFRFNLDESFFSHFEASPIKKCQIDTLVVLDKRESMLLWAFEFKGHIRTTCDRCLETIQLPIHTSHDLIMKYGMPKEDSDVVFIAKEEPNVQLAPFLYEFACLSLPLVSTYKCDEDEHAPCNDEILKHIAEDDAKPFKDEGGGNTDLADQLKNLDVNWNK